MRMLGRTPGSGKKGKGHKSRAPETTESKLQEAEKLFLLQTAQAKRKAELVVNRLSVYLNEQSDQLGSSKARLTIAEHYVEVGVVACWERAATIAVEAYIARVERTENELNSIQTSLEMKKRHCEILQTSAVSCTATLGNALSTLHETGSHLFEFPDKSTAENQHQEGDAQMLPQRVDLEEEELALDHALESLTSAEVEMAILKEKQSILSSQLLKLKKELQDAIKTHSTFAEYLETKQVELVHLCESHDMDPETELSKLTEFLPGATPPIRSQLNSSNSIKERGLQSHEVRPVEHESERRLGWVNSRRLLKSAFRAWSAPISQSGKELGAKVEG